jgi:hypothetical protein
MTTAPSHAMAGPTPVRGAARSIRLLPRHWDWLDAQPRGADASLRRLAEQACRDEHGIYRRAVAKEACYFLMRDIGGDRPHFEAAVRALFADDPARLRRSIASWPAHVVRQLEPVLASIWDTTAAGED